VPRWTPSYHRPENPDYPTDHWLVEGVKGDRVADWFFGRIPCQTSQQLDQYLMKLETWLGHAQKTWNTDLLWVSDDGTPFEDNTRRVFREFLPLQFKVKHLRVRDYPFVDNFYYGDHLKNIQQVAQQSEEPLDYGKISPTCNSAMRKALTEGAGLWIYYGHSGLNVLAHERILFGGGSTQSDIPGIRNGGKCPLAFLMTCDVGRYDYAEIAKWSYGLAEELLLSPEGGCLGLVTSTGRGVPNDHMGLIRGCLDALINHQVSAAGAMLWCGKVQALISRSNLESVDMFTFLGDPLWGPLFPERQMFRPLDYHWDPEGTLYLTLPIPVNSANGWVLDADLVPLSGWKMESGTNEKTHQLVIPDAIDQKLLYIGLINEKSDNPTVGFALDPSQLTHPAGFGLIGSGSPDLVIKPESIRFENYSPRSGETLFIQAGIYNTGTVTATGVQVLASDGITGKPVLQFADFPELIIPRIHPGETRELRIRADRWSGVGDIPINIQVDPENQIAESDETNNSATATIHILDKSDLGWGMVHGSTAEAVDWKRVTPLPDEWIRNPQTANLGPLEMMRPSLAAVDRGAVIPVALTNFGETVSSTCTIRIEYWREGEDKPFLEPPAVLIPPIAPSISEVHPKSVPVIVFPGITRIQLLVDPDKIVDEQTRTNNTLDITIPPGFWERLPAQRETRVEPKALK
jgi:hypothetical protein